MTWTAQSLETVTLPPPVTLPTTRVAPRADRHPHPRVPTKCQELGQMASGNRIDRLGGKRNYNRLGRAQLSVARAFIAAGGRDSRRSGIKFYFNASP